MHTMRQRSCDIVASAVSAFLVMALLTAATTIMRDVLLRPRPVVHDVRVSSMSPLYQVRAPTLLSLSNPDAALYYLPGGSGDGDGGDNASAATPRLPANIVRVNLHDAPEDSEEDRKRKAWQRQQLPDGHDYGIRSTNRVVLYLSGVVDFAPCWDWNTKAIYVAFIARFHSATTSQNDVVLLDAVLRPVTLTSSMARLVARRRQARTAAPATAAVSNGAAAALTEAEQQQLADFEMTLRNREHDHPSVSIDHIEKRLVLRDSFKYFVNAFDDTSLEGNTVEVILRYQVMSYSGWAPVREDVLGHQVQASMPATAVPWQPQQPQHARTRR